jgi:uncharacterized protein
MDLLEKNGQPSMEEILASIRRIIAEEPADAIFLNPKAIDGTAAAVAAAVSEADDGADFKLPSMFRPTSPQVSENVNTAPVRLTDALKLATAAVENEIKANGAAGHLNGAGYLNGNANGGLTDISTQAYPSLSSLKAPRPDSAPIVTIKADPAAAVAAALAAQIPAPFAPASEPPLAAPAPSEAPVARKMASFADSRFTSMKTMAAPVPVAPQPEPVAVAAVAVTQALPSLVVPQGAQTSQAQQSQAAVGVDDQTAELLRPMLRQWLTENMPRMVEKALFMEVNTTNGQKKD